MKSTTTTTNGVGTRRASEGPLRDSPSAPAYALMFEGRVVFEYLATMACGPFLASAPRGDGHTVLLVPGFMQDELMVLVLQSYLNILGYDTHVWNEGVGADVNPDMLSRFADRVETLATASGAPASVIGCSLGGLFARAVAVHRPRC